MWFQPPEYAAVSVGSATDFTAQRFPSAVNVTGLGQSAWWEPSLGELGILSGQRSLIVIVVSQSVDTRNAAVQIARAALPRLRHDR